MGNLVSHSDNINKRITVVTLSCFPLLKLDDYIKPVNVNSFH